MLHDVTVLLRAGMRTYPGEDGPRLDLLKSRAAGDEADVRKLTLALHTGTHVDAPQHFIEGGKTVEALPLDALVGPCEVLDITGAPDVGAADLEALFPSPRAAPERILFRTRNSTGPRPMFAREGFDWDYAGIGHDAASWLVERRVKLVGIDYLSIEPPQAKAPVTHLKLLGAGVVAIEGLDLRRVTPGRYRLYCLPALLQGADGAPARVILED